MTNWEKYKDKFLNVPTNNFCTEFCEPILRKFGKKCKNFSCDKCRILISYWLQEEYKEPEVDWSEVEVDTQILVSNNGEEYTKRHFARYESGRVFTWAKGKTSWTTYGNGSIEGWLYAKLVEEKK